MKSSSRWRFTLPNLFRTIFLFALGFLSLVESQLRFSTISPSWQNRAAVGFNNDSSVDRQIAHFPFPPATWSPFATPATSWSWANNPQPGFMLQSSNISYNSLLNSNQTYYIIEPSTSPLKREQIADLRTRGKIVLARLSIGQADRSLPYWQAQWADRPPEFLDQEDQTRPGHFRVMFWRPQWQRMILRYMRERVAPLGFSGLLLDGADSYQYFTEDHPQGRDDMINLIRTTRDQASALGGNQVIIVNNAEDLYSSSQFRSMVDGLATESTWFANDTDLSLSNPQQVENVLRLLRQARRDGKVVLAADYPSRSDNICTFYDRCTAEGFLCLATDYNLTGAIRVCDRRPSTPWSQSGRPQMNYSIIPRYNAGFSLQTSIASLCMSLFAILALTN
ncbi:hypothetical protein RvY_18219 [Ramazzottius varieornatus]|uniref:Glycoside-hydrolase family GH114 TIM-barrel domain-containing protein n=1 Tax=Ramazzottius varieornatus TaxID=947166 RepID=A0A1D1W5I5_RAMVA|nr:hypothetical protein RvY_18219 [Ramazzottius varieornatus]